MAIATQGLLPQAGRSEDSRLCIVSEDEQVYQAVALAYPTSGSLVRFSVTGLVDSQNELSQHGEDVLDAARDADAVLVEWRLDLAPVINTLGFHLRRQPTTPLVALCRNGLDEELAAMAAGCDAAVSFPVRPALIQSIVLAHRRLVAAAIRAAAPGPDQPDAVRDEQSFGPLRINRTAYRLFVNEVEVLLTPREYSLLDFLIRHRDELCTRDDILAQVWGINFDTGTNMVDVYMYFLRRKLEAHNAEGMIQTVRGRGYRLALPDPNSSSEPASANAVAAREKGPPIRKSTGP